MIKVDIVNREKRDGKTVRILICGHTQEEPKGGKAHLAKRAFCSECGVVKEKAPQEKVSSNVTCIQCGTKTDAALCDSCWLGPRKVA